MIVKMKKSAKHILILLLALVTMFSTFPVTINAEEAVSSITRVTLGKGVVITKNATIDQQAVYQSALPSVIKWRQDALNDTSIKVRYNAIFYTMREYLSKIGITESEYLHPQWSNALENISIQRAVETTLLLEHARPNGTWCFEARVGNEQSWNEIIAWGVSNVAGAMDSWAKEKADYQKWVKGESGGGTGHYWTIIDPEIKYYGFAGCGNNWVGEGGYSTSNLSPTNLKGTYNFEVALSEDEVSDAKWAGSNTISVGSKENYAVSFKYGTQTFAAKGTWSSSDTSVATVDSNGNLTGLKKGNTTITLTSGTKTFTQDIKVINEAVMYRMYNPNSGEHFYTANVEEKNNLVNVGWKYEGKGWIAPKTSKTPVYRLYSGTDHHYTTSSKEREELVKAGWKDEGIGWYSDDSKGVPLYRQYNPNVDPTAQTNNSGSHNYTTSKEENDNLVKVGWKAEGIAWYGIKS